MQNKYHHKGLPNGNTHFYFKFILLNVGGKALQVAPKISTENFA